jgi:RNA polymerase sigma-70 factor, ECF subfamily
MPVGTVRHYDGSLPDPAMSPLRPLHLIHGTKTDGAQPDGSSTAARSLIIHAAKSGDVRAFATLVDIYYARCLRFALHMLYNRLDAEEAVQDTFVRVYRALPRYREDASFEAWLFRILANRCRSAGSRVRRHEDFIRYGEVPDRPSGVYHDATLAWREEIELALTALPIEQREAFLLRHVEDLSYDEMSRVTGVGISALKMRVKRACDALRDTLNEVDGE